MMWGDQNILQELKKILVIVSQLAPQCFKKLNYLFNFLFRPQLSSLRSYVNVLPGVDEVIYFLSDNTANTISLVTDAGSTVKLYNVDVLLGTKIGSPLQASDEITNKQSLSVLIHAITVLHSWALYFPIGELYFIKFYHGHWGRENCECNPWKKFVFVLFCFPLNYVSVLLPHLWEWQLQPTWMERNYFTLGFMITNKKNTKK